MPVEYFRWRVDGRHPPLLVAAQSSWTRTVARRTAHAVRRSLRSRPSYISGLYKWLNISGFTGLTGEKQRFVWRFYQLKMGVEAGEAGELSIFANG